MTRPGLLTAPRRFRVARPEERRAWRIDEPRGCCSGRGTVPEWGGDLRLQRLDDCCALAQPPSLQTSQRRFRAVWRVSDPQTRGILRAAGRDWSPTGPPIGSGTTDKRVKKVSRSRCLIHITPCIAVIYAHQIDIDSLWKLTIICPAGKFGNPGNNGEDYRMQKGRDVKDLRIRRAKG